MVTFDATINIGHILEAFVFIIGIIAAYYGLKNKQSSTDAALKALLEDVTGMKDELHKITSILVTLGRQDERLNSHERRITALENTGQ